MGTTITLEIDPRQIDRARWAAAYDEIYEILQAAPRDLARLDTRVVFGERVPVYVRALEGVFGRSGERRLGLSGDLHSRRVGALFELCRDLDHYLHRSHGLDADRGAPAADLLARAPDQPGAGFPVFYGDTQGAPYRHSVLAVATLIEQRFPGAAVVGGDIDRAQATAALELLAAPRARRTQHPPPRWPPELPVRTDPHALWARLTELVASGQLAQPVSAAFERLYCGHPWDQLAPILSQPADRPPRERLGAALARCRDAHIPLAALCARWLDGGGSLLELLALACRAPDGPRLPAALVMAALADADVTGAGARADALGGALGNDDPNNDNDSDDNDSNDNDSDDHENMSPALMKLLRTARARRQAQQVTRTGVSEDTLHAAVKSVFGGAADALMSGWRSRRVAHTHQTETWQRLLRAVAAHSVPSARDAVAPLVEITSPDELSAVQSQLVELVAYAAGPAGDRPPNLWRALGSAPTARSLLARRMGWHTPLSEDAWAWIGAETRPRVLVFLVALALMEDPSANLSGVRRALFERPALCEHAVALSEDSAKMEEVERRNTVRQPIHL